MTDGLGLLGRGAGTEREGDGLALVDKLLRELTFSGPALVTLFPGDKDLQVPNYDRINSLLRYQSQLHRDVSQMSYNLSA